MPFKPRVIILLSLIYFFSPPLILISSSYVSLVPLTGPSGILDRLTPGDVSILISYYFLSLCLFSVRNWGWWGFIAGSIYLISYNVYGYIRNPFYTPLVLVLYTALLSSAAALLFRKELIAPYFNPRLRWWETEKRYELSFDCRINTGAESLTVPIVDISKGGCFLAIDRPAPRSSAFNLDIRINGLYVTLKGEVVRSSDHPVRGWGIHFKDLSLIENRGLKELMNLLKAYNSQGRPEEKRKHNRYINPYCVFLGGPAVTDGKQINCTIENISRSGFCLILDDDQWLTGEKDLFLSLTAPQFREGEFHFGKPLAGKIIWTKCYDGIYTLGAEFTDLNRKDNTEIGKLIRDFKRMGGKERRQDRERDRKLIEESLLLSPRGKIKSFLSAGKS